MNISGAAASLYTSQSGIGRQIRQLEQELGVDLFVRNGKRPVELTEPGKAILTIATRLLQACPVEQYFRTCRQPRGDIAVRHRQLLIAAYKPVVQVE